MAKDLTPYAQQRLIFALDVPDLDEAKRLVRLLSGRVGLFKVGLELFTSAGPDAIRAIRDEGGEVFLDLKLHDIPTTVARTSAAIATLGVKMFTIHACGGTRMIAAAVQSSREASLDSEREPPKVIAVTALTSLSAGELTQVGLGKSALEVVERLARLAHAAGVDGMVTSAQEVGRLRGMIGPEPSLVTPAIRPDWHESASRTPDDQSRVATPHAAILNGADYLVVGRPIRDSDDPSASADRILDEISRGLKSRKQKARAGN